jgi:hypothetical protein
MCYGNAGGDQPSKNLKLKNLKNLRSLSFYGPVKGRLRKKYIAAFAVENPLLQTH